jgi:cell wall-associated NlpC family hydrolase
LKEEQFLRYLLASGVFALLLAGSTPFAFAADSATASAPQASTVSAQAESNVQPDVSADSPDVAVWTAQLIEQQRAEQAHPEARGLRGFASHILARTTAIARSLTRDALRFLGTPYVFGGTSTSGFDCSGYVQHVFAMMGIHLPRTADAQYYAGNRIRGDMKPGDLVFFQTYEPGPSHVGIYLGDGKFVHAASEGVMVSNLSDAYWANRYLGARRYIASTK